MDRPAPNIFTIAPNAPFLRQLARSWLAGELTSANPHHTGTQLDTIFYLPTRRAARSFADTLAGELGGTALLPRIRTLADVDEDEALDAPLDVDDPSRLPPSDAPLAPILPAVSGVRRRLILARMIETAGEALIKAMEGASIADYPVFPQSATESTHLAKALAALIDQVATEESDWQALVSLVPDDHAAYWQLTLTLLNLVTQNWPTILAEEGALDPATRRRLILDARTARLIGEPPTTPIIAAGSTGSIPATARFLASIARAPAGAVVLPGLDMTLPDAGFDRLHSDDVEAASHPQQGLARLLKAMQATRADVRALGDAVGARQQIVSRALLPASSTWQWSEQRPSGDRLGDPLGGVQLVETATENEESLAIALQMKAQLSKGSSVALVTPDRALAQRVQLDLARFGIAADDSAGQPLRETVPGRLMIAAAQAFASGFAAVPLLALLKHPLCTLGRTASATRQAARTLERLALRGPALPPGLDVMREVIAERAAERAAGDTHVPALRRSDTPDHDATALDMIDRLEAAFALLSATLSQTGDVDFAAYSEALFVASEQVCATEDVAAPNPLYAGPAGEALAAHRVALADSADIRFSVPASEAGGVFEALLADPVVRPRSGGQAGATIWGPLEARLQPVDHIILAGLNEKAWPNLPDANPFLSRTMMAGMELAIPERRIGLSAHDFEQAMGCPEVTLTRARKVDGTPTVPSRWLQRLLAYLPTDATNALRNRAAPLLALASSWDDPEAFRPESPPSPRPADPPRRLSITEVETLIRDPYAVFARRVLKLEPAPGLGEPPGARERGDLVHSLVQRMAADLDALPQLDWPDAYRRHAHDLLEELSAFPSVQAFWARRIDLMEADYLAYEANAGADLLSRRAEITGALELSISGQACVLSGRADRIDVHTDGAASLIDFKTGAPPSNKQVAAGLAPQLPLGAAMLESGAFEGMDGRSVRDASYVRLGAPGTPVKPTSFTAEDLRPDEALEQLQALWATYLAGAPFRPLVRPMLTRFVSDYHHLARAKAWQIADDGEASA